MAKHKLTNDDKALELKKYRDLVLVTIDYYQENNLMNSSADYYNSLRKLTKEQFQKGRLTRLKQWFRDFTEMQIETSDLKFNKYLQEKTQYDIDIFKSYFQGIDRIVAKGKIMSDNQFYDIYMAVDQLCQIEPVDKVRIEFLNKLLKDYEQRKQMKTSKPNA